MMGSLKNIETRNELADFIGVPRNKLAHVLYSDDINNRYSSFCVPKKSGGDRHINAPDDDLKSIQRKLADALWTHQKGIQDKNNVRTNISHGFEHGKNIITNAKIHRNKRFVLNIDLENFFDSFHFGRVKGFFLKNNNYQLPLEVATVIAQLTCYRGCLPQGAPTSPIITNLICQILDFRILGISKQYKLDYTRYADDLTFSTNNKNFLEKYDSFIQALNDEIERAGFKINEKKTRLLYRDSRQEVTGLIVNKKINVDSRYYKTTRAMAHTLYSDGAFKIGQMDGTKNQLEGRFAFINQVARYNNEIDGNSHSYRCLNAREEQYRRFLFYKYFFDNNKPMIITEGKTDVLYIKAALKNLSSDYPDLVTKMQDGNFEFHISFLNRTKRLRYFLGTSLDGADTMKNIYSFYSGKEKMPNYLKYFESLCERRPTMPSILIFDNELRNKDKPLHKFTNYAKTSEDQKYHLEQDLYLEIADNLYILTNPLVNSLSECEIEDLFSTQTLSHKINGKRFSRDSNNDQTHTYGKDRFSKYVSNNYQNIDFTGFKPFLDKLNWIVEISRGLYTDST